MGRRVNEWMLLPHEHALTLAHEHSLKLRLKSWLEGTSTYYLLTPKDFINHLTNKPLVQSTNS